MSILYGIVIDIINSQVILLLLSFLTVSETNDILSLITANLKVYVNLCVNIQYK